MCLTNNSEYLVIRQTKRFSFPTNYHANKPLRFIIHVEFANKFFSKWLWCKNSLVLKTVWIELHTILVQWYIAFMMHFTTCNNVRSSFICGSCVLLPYYSPILIELTPFSDPYICEQWIWKTIIAANPDWNHILFFPNWVRIMIIRVLEHDSNFILSDTNTF